MKTFKLMIILSAVVFINCSSVWSQEAVQPTVLCCAAYLNSDGTANQAAIEAAIDGGADPITLAAELVGARCEQALRCCDLSPEFSVAVWFAAPHVDIGALTSAVTGACPDQGDRVTDALLAVLPGKTDQTLTFRTAPDEDYLTNKKPPKPSPSQ